MRERWLEEDVRKLARLAKQGKTAAEVATIMGVHYSRIASKAQALGIRFQSRWGKHRKMYPRMRAPAYHARIRRVNELAPFLELLKRHRLEMEKSYYECPEGYEGKIGSILAYFDEIKKSVENEMESNKAQAHIIMNREGMELMLQQQPRKKVPDLPPNDGGRLRKQLGHLGWHKGLPLRYKGKKYAGVMR